jgi:hypothetical protein
MGEFCGTAASAAGMSMNWMAWRWRSICKILDPAGSSDVLGLRASRGYAGIGAVAQQVATAPHLEETLLTGLERRRRWPSKGAVKIWITNPTVAVVLHHDGGDLVIHAWGSNEKHFNVAMMWVDEGPTLYAITEEEWQALRSRNQK